MSVAEVVDNSFDLQTGTLNNTAHIVTMIHLAVAIGDGGKIKTCHRQAEGCKVVFLTVPEGLHDA